MRFCGGCGAKLPVTTDASSKGMHTRAIALCGELRKSLSGHVRAWEGRPLTERQRLEYDFQAETGMPPEQAADRMQSLEDHLRKGEFAKIEALGVPLKELATYFDHFKCQLSSMEKDPKKRKEAEKKILHYSGTALELADIVASLVG